MKVKIKINWTKLNTTDITTKPFIFISPDLYLLITFVHKSEFQTPYITALELELTLGLHIGVYVSI